MMRIILKSQCYDFNRIDIANIYLFN